MSELEIQSSQEADLIVIGGAGAGLSAALRAWEGGVKKIILIERGKIFGGCTRFAGGLLAVESPAQKRQGIKDTSDQIWRDHMEKADWFCDPMLCRKWFNESGKVIEWLENKGMYFNECEVFSGDRILFHRMGLNTGNELVNHLLDALKKTGVDMHIKTRALKLLTDASGAVCGVVAQCNGEELTYKAKAVIIATGSISANDDLVKKYCPQVNLARTKVMANVATNQGDGLVMATEIGAAVGLITPLYLGPNNHPNNLGVGLLMRRPHPMTVNKNGVRYIDESIHSQHRFGCIAGVALELQPGKVCYPIIDQKILDDMIAHKENLTGVEKKQGREKNADRTSGFGEEDGMKLSDAGPTDWLDKLPEDIRTEAAAGRAVIAQTMDEVADFIGCDHNILKDSVTRYNQSCKFGYDRDFLKTPKYLLPIENSPYYAFLAKQGIDTCIGGIKINSDQEVLNKDLNPIDGLYAAGVATSGFLGHGYSFPGTELGYSVYSGYTAGRLAAEQIIAKNKTV